MWSTSAHSATIAQYSNTFGAAATDSPAAVTNKSRWHRNLIQFLALTQRQEVDILPFTWQPQADSLGQGGTALVSQTSTGPESGFAFKRFDVFIDKKDVTDTDVYDALISEVSVLTHPAMRMHPNIINLEGICWEVDTTSKGPPKIWPVLIFERAHHGSLEKYARKCRIEICTKFDILYDVLCAIEHMHGKCKRRASPTLL